jgi:hypothetical protein
VATSAALLFRMERHDLSNKNILIPMEGQIALLSHAYTSGNPDKHSILLTGNNDETSAAKFPA